MTLEKGDHVRTGAAGTATLVVRDRRVVLGAATKVRVPDGATLELDRGALLVDRRRGPGLLLRAGEATIDDVGAGALRVERLLTVRVAGLSAGARVRTATGAEADVSALYQAVVAGRGITEPIPLQLNDDAWERSVVPDLVADDIRLNDLAEGLDGPGGPVIPAAYRPAAGARVSDLVLTDAIGRAADRAQPARAAGRARALRGQGGSWGVVARLLRTSAIDVASALSDVLTGVPAAQSPTATTAPGNDGGVVAGPSPRPGVTPSPQPSATRPPSPGPTTKPPRTGSPTTSPSTSPDPVSDLLKVLETPPLLPPIGL
jgi:hypothetical protein